MYIEWSLFFAQCIFIFQLKQLNNNKDNRCVANQRALLESGTLGAKGHVPRAK